MDGDPVAGALFNPRSVALIGASGSGKSTLLRCINQLEVVDDVTVVLEGRDITDPRVDADAVRARIGMVFQSFNLFAHKTVLENVTLGPVKVRHQPAAQARERARELLRRVGVEPQAEKYPAQLSGGQQQRVGVARALAADPPIMLMDEPFGAVDPILRRELRAELRRIHAETRKTVLLVTHDPAEALELATHLVVLRDGRRVGHNTDWWGFAEGFRRGLPGAPLRWVVQLGAGGAGARSPKGRS